MIVVTFFTTPIHAGIKKRYRTMRIASAIGLTIFKNLPQQRQFIANGVPEFYLLLMSQFSENALTCVCQNLPKTRLKFRSQVLPLVVKFFEDLCDLLFLFGRQGKFLETRIELFRNNRWLLKSFGQQGAKGNPCPHDTDYDPYKKNQDKSDDTF